MEHLIQIYLYLPLAGFLLSLLIPRKKERIISALVTGVMCAHLLGMAGMLGLWIQNGWTTIDLKHLVLFKSGHFEFFINFYFDKVTAVYMLVGSLITSLVMVFSRYYMHRDEGFKRFFNTLLFFYLGYNLVIFAGNFETLFIGWEILGITSFLLIAFYRDRYLPVRNGLKVISLYRLGDVCLILAMWMAHHLFQKNITFAELQIPGFIQPYIQADAFSVTFIALMVLIAVAAKSAQLPFSSWLPRAMEGPTTSSAIFYGSLSVHLGVFLLLRTYPLWQDLILIKIFIIVIGVTTALIATGIAKVQSSVKTQIAYSSITQIAIIFIEVALGFHTLALVHFSGNAFLRTYQLLVSPSVLGYLIHDQFFNHAPTRATTTQGFIKKITNTVYLLSVKEWNLDRVLYRVLWNPFKWAGKQLNFLDSVLGRVLVFLLFATGIAFLFMEELRIDLEIFLPELFSLTALAFIVKAFTERGNALRAWSYIFTSQLLIVLSICLNEHVETKQVVYYLSGTIASGITGIICLWKIRSVDGDISLDRFHGYSYERPGLALIFLLSCLGLLGFPFTPTFIGIDLLFTHIHTHQVVLLISTALGFLVIELSVLRIYARIFLGQHKKMYHPVAYRSS